MREEHGLAGTSINCLAIVLKEMDWSYTRLIAELRRQAAIDGVVLPKTESLFGSLADGSTTITSPTTSTVTYVVGRPEA